MAKSFFQLTHSEIDKINKVCIKLGNSKQQLDIINWLANFDRREWGKAFEVSEKIKYFSSEEIISELNDFLKKILIKHPEKIIYLSFLGEFGKSGSYLMYYIKKTPCYKANENYIKILDSLKTLRSKLKENDILLLIDDIIGTGESTVKFYNYVVKQQLRKNKSEININIILLCIAYMSDSTKLITKNIKKFEIYGTPYHKAFVSSNSVFGRRKKMILIKNFCTKYGAGLFSLENIMTRVNVSYPLGYGNSQSLIVFEHSAPNNTLPIIWSTKNSWIPLFPRSTEFKISKFKEFRDNNIIWFNIAKELGIISNNEDFKSSNFKNIDFRILAVLRLKIKRMNDMSICQKLNITLNALEEIYNNGKVSGDFDNNNEVSEKGRKNYNLILKKRQQQKTKTVSLENKGLYIPEKFFNRS